jgi:hypothetical protein
MKKSITLFVVAGLVLALAPAAQAITNAPTDGYDVGAYRIAFTTTTLYAFDGSTDIGHYNGIVSGVAAGVSELNALGATWKMIGSTAAMSARVNTGTTATDGKVSSGDVPIYNVNGDRVADNNAALWGVGPYPTPPATELLNNIRNETGGNNGWAYIVTGTLLDGSNDSGSELGTATPRRAQHVATTHAWIYRYNANPAESHGYMAMSSVLRIPPPAGTVLIVK